ncbi:hypothetical protein ACFQ0B_10830 [Nonomuraea thailandensis]
MPLMEAATISPATTPGTALAARYTAPRQGQAEARNGSGCRVRASSAVLLSTL